MTCDEARKAIPGLALGEADVEVSREVSAHLDACASCRAEREAQERALSAMRGMIVETSERRRDAAIGAMTGARDELVERAIMRRPSVWPLRIVGVAAAVIVAVAIGYVALRPDPTWRVVSLNGKASRDGVAVGLSDVLRPDETLSMIEGTAVLESGAGRIELSRLACVTIRSRSRVQLMEGTMRAETTQELTITNRWTDRVIVRAGGATVASDLTNVMGSDAKEPQKQAGDRLRVHVERGQAVMRGSRGELLLEAGQKSRLDPEGTPAN